MLENSFTELLDKKKLLVSDGATGTNLFDRGLPRGITAEQWVLEKPEEILRLHQDFIKAGADIILTCTFGGSSVRLEHAELDGRFEEINKKASEIALEAVQGTEVLVAGSIGPLGQMIKPFGTLTVEEAKSQYFAQAKALAESGIHLLLIETQFDINEAAAAVTGAIKASNLPIICSFSFDRGTKTMMGVSPTQFAEEIGGLGVSALGINCGKSLEDNTDALKELSNCTELPIWFKPNAGLPTLDADGSPAYDVSPHEMGSHVNQWIEIGARIIGGCCGTSPGHLQAIAKKVKQS
jgi:5-methyltetrahydrofolate--homocysteine methyltransferase